MVFKIIYCLLFEVNRDASLYTNNCCMDLTYNMVPMLCLIK